MRHFSNSSARPLPASSEFALDYFSACTGGYRCSTPFGIIGIRTLSQHVHQAGIRAVLNAFRHHRNSHPVTEANGVSRVMCSTPFGIIGIRTGLIDAHVVEPKRAEIHSASSEF